MIDVLKDLLKSKLKIQIQDHHLILYHIQVKAIHQIKELKEGEAIKLIKGLEWRVIHQIEELEGGEVFHLTEKLEGGEAIHIKEVKEADLTNKIEEEINHIDKEAGEEKEEILQIK